MSGSIRLETEDYCFGCELYEPECSKDIIYGEDKAIEVVVVVSCKDLERCRRIANRVVPPGQKNEKTLGGP